MDIYKLRNSLEDHCNRQMRCGPDEDYLNPEFFEFMLEITEQAFINADKCQWIKNLVTENFKKFGIFQTVPRAYYWTSLLYEIKKLHEKLLDAELREQFSKSHIQDIVHDHNCNAGWKVFFIFTTILSSIAGVIFYHLK